MLAFVTGWCVALSGTTALDTVGSQAFTGGSRPTDLSIHLQRCILILWILMIPVCVFWAFVEPVLLALGQPAQLSKDVQRFLRVLIIGAPGYIGFESLKKYLQCQGIMRASTMELIIVFPVNLGLGIALIHHTSLGLTVTMSLENEVQALRQELADKGKKLQDYADAIVSLHGELRTLRNIICDTCKRKLVLANLESSHDAVASSSIVNHPHSQVLPEHKNRLPKRQHSPDYLPNRSGSPPFKIPKHSIHNSSQTPLTKRSSPSYTLPTPRVVAVHDKPTLILSQRISSSKAIQQKFEPSLSRWSAKRDATTDAALEVTFVRAFINKGSVPSVRFSPDGKCLAAALGNFGGSPIIKGATVIYNVETGEQTCVLAENPSKYSFEEIRSISCLSFSPDGRHLAVGDNKHQVSVWDTPNKRIRNIFKGHSQSIKCVNLSPNGRFVLSVCWDDDMRLWNLRDGSAKILRYASLGDIWSAPFSPNGRYIAAGNTNGTLMMWDVRTFRLVKRWIGEGSVAFTPDGKGLLSGHSDGTVKNWNIGSLGMVQSNGGAVPVPINLEYKGLEICL